MHVLDEQVVRAGEWCDRPRFAGIRRLYSSRDVAAQHGGSAWIAEPSGKAGAVFVIALPAAKDTSSSASAHAAASPAMANKPVLG